MTTPVLGTDLAAMRRLNGRAVLTTLWAQAEPQTATRIAQVTGLSRTTVEAVLSDLQEQGLVSVQQLKSSRAGRPARGYDFASRRGVVVGLDIGPHAVSGVASDLRGERLTAVVRHEADLADGSTALGAIARLVDGLLSGAGFRKEQIAALTVGIPGVVDVAGRPAKTTVVPQWLEMDIVARLEALFPSSPIVFDNDSKLAAAAEVEFGAIGGGETAVLLRLGNRISAATVVDGRVARGAHGAAGEIGALERIGWPAAQRRLMRRAGAGLPALFDAGQAGEGEAVQVIREFASGIADGLAALVLALDPQAIVVNSSVPLAASQLLRGLESELADRVLYVPELRASTLGSAAVSLGAIVSGVGRVRGSLTAP